MQAILPTNFQTSRSLLCAPRSKANWPFGSHGSSCTCAIDLSLTFSKAMLTRLPGTLAPGILKPALAIHESAGEGHRRTAGCVATASEVLANSGMLTADAADAQFSRKCRDVRLCGAAESCVRLMRPAFMCLFFHAFPLGANKVPPTTNETQMLCRQLRGWKPGRFCIVRCRLYVVHEWDDLHSCHLESVLNDNVAGTWRR